MTREDGQVRERDSKGWQEGEWTGGKDRERERERGREREREGWCGSNLLCGSGVGAEKMEMKGDRKENFEENLGGEKERGVRDGGGELSMTRGWSGVEGNVLCHLAGPG